MPDPTDPAPPKLGKSFKSNDGLLIPFPSLEKPLPSADPNAFASDESPPPDDEVGKRPIPPGLEPRLRNPEEPLDPPGAVDPFEFADDVVDPSICSVLDFQLVNAKLERVRRMTVLIGIKQVKSGITHQKQKKIVNET